MTIPNLLTFFRIFLIPIFLAIITFYTKETEYLRYVGFAICIIAIITDLSDGYIARKFNLCSELGARLDPLADKLAVNLSLAFIASNTAFDYPIPLWFPPLVLFRDTVLVVGTYLISRKLTQVKVMPRFWGKITSFVLSLYIAIVLLQIKILVLIFLVLSMFLTLLSLFDYLWVGIRFALNYQITDGKNTI
ncbi:MAG: CDP-alcohol phosphatidyltransferase family protein [Candidatus Hydrogenedens sp.]